MKIELGDHWANGYGDSIEAIEHNGTMVFGVRIPEKNTESYYANTFEEACQAIRDYRNKNLDFKKLTNEKNISG